MSSIIASSEPPDAGSTPGTGRGMLSSFSMPIDCARRRAGSMVSTTTLRPRSAARRASAADVVVLPTPPEPQHTMMPVPRSSSRASTSRLAAGPACGPTRPRVRVLGRVLMRGPRGSASAASGFVGGSCHALVAEGLCELVEAAEVAAPGEAVQLVGRHAEAVDHLTLLVLQRPPYGVVLRLAQQPVEQRGTVHDAGLLQVGLDRGPVQGAGARHRERLGVEVARAHQV